MKQFPLFLISIICTYSLLGQAPSITNITPPNGILGSQITINGTNFNPNPINNIVYFGPVKAIVNSSSTSTLTVNVPFGTNYKPVTVLNNNLIGISKNPFVITNPSGGQNFINTSFASPVGFGGGSSVTEGDFDLDGKIDVASTRFSSNEVVIGRNTTNNGILSFSNSILSGMVNPIDIESADINGDGLLDLIVTSLAYNVAYMLKNTSTIGNISFSGPTFFATGSEPRKITTGDLNNDGKIDIIVSNQSSNSISILRNTSTISTIAFAAKVDFTTSATPEGVCVGDMDGDGKIDILVACSGASAVSLFKNTSSAASISLNPRIDYGTGAFPWEVFAADIDGDNKLDIVSSNTGPNTVSILKNTTLSNLTFAAKVDFATTTSPRGLVINDLDTDGKPDIITVNYSSGSEACVLKNISTVGNILFNPFSAYPVGAAAVGLCVADFNTDGLADIITSNSANNIGSLTYFKNQLQINTGIATCPQLIYPSNNSVNIEHSSPLLMRWRKDINAVSYQLKITPQLGTPILITTTDTSYNFIPIANTIYTWAATPTNLPNNNNCNSFTFTTCNIITNSTTIISVGGNVSKCVNDSIKLKASTANNIQWFYNNQIIQGQNSDSLWIKSPGNYAIKIFNSGCYSDASNTITINDLLTPSKPILSASGLTTFCSNTTLTLNSNAININNQWYKNNVNIAGANGSTYIINSTGSYFARVTEISTGCHNYSDTIAVIVNAVPVTPVISVISGNTTFCQNQTLKLGSSSNVGNQWYKDNIVINGAILMEYTTTSGGAYTVKVTQNACTSITSNIINVTVNPVPSAPTLTLSGGNNSFCDGDSVALSTNIVTGIKWYKDGIIINSATNPTYYTKESGNYLVTSTISGCESINNNNLILTKINLPIKPVIQLTNGNNLSVANNYASYKWYLNGLLINGSTSNQILVAQNGKYKVEVTNSGSNCKNISDEFNVVLNDLNAIVLSGDKIKVFPIPVVNNLSIELLRGSFLNETITVSVFDDLGRKIADLKLKNGLNIVNLEAYKNGAYQILLQKGNLKKAVKILKIK